MPSTPEKLIEIHTRHISHNERVKSSNVKEYEKFLKQMSTSVKKRLSGTKPLTKYTVDRLNKLNANIKKDLDDIGNKVYEKFKIQAIDLGKYESEFEIKSLNQVVEHSFTLPSTSQLNSAIFKTPLAQLEGISEGQLLESFFKDLSNSTVSKIQGSIISGYYTGLTNTQIIQSIIGTKRMNFRDGDFGKKWRHMESVVRTGLQHAANQARQETWNRNSDIIKGVMWLSTLDSRTTITCQGLDTKVFPLDSGPRPPAHIGCRSTTVAQLDDRFSILSEDRTRAARDPITGEVYSIPAERNYYDWLKGQPDSIQDSIIGPSRGKLLRDGGISSKRFAELQLGKNFEPLTLKQMKALEPVVFQNAGVLKNFSVDELLMMKADIDLSSMTPKQIATYKKNLAAYNKKVSSAKKSIKVANKQRITAKKKLSVLKKKKADPALISDAERTLKEAELKVKERELKLKQITGEVVEEKVEKVVETTLTNTQTDFSYKPTLEWERGLPGKRDAIKYINKNLFDKYNIGSVYDIDEDNLIGTVPYQWEAINEIGESLDDIYRFDKLQQNLIRNLAEELDDPGATTLKGIDLGFNTPASNYVAVFKPDSTIMFTIRAHDIKKHTLHISKNDWDVGNDFKSIFRHEYGHYINVVLDKDSVKIWNDFYDKNSSKFKNISRYATTNRSEAFAETFAAITSPKYDWNGKYGSLTRLPKNIEDLMISIIGKPKVARAAPKVAKAPLMAVANNLKPCII